MNPVPCPCCDGAGTLPRRASQLLLLERAVVDEKTGCWIWTKRVDKWGYGLLTHRGHRWTAHRLSFVAFGGTFRDGPLALHSCDRSACINPAHLSAGTPTENMADRYARGRYDRSVRLLQPRTIPVGTAPELPPTSVSTSECHCCLGTGTVDATAWQTLIRDNTRPGPDGCLTWTGKVNKYGYGDIYVDRHRFTAHRLSFIAFKGTLASDAVVRHRCHNRDCVAPNHLVPGTVLQNVQDRVARGLIILNHGANNGGARLTSEHVTEIRLRRLSGVRLSALQDEFNISVTAMHRIVTGQSWKAQDEDLIRRLETVEPHRTNKACRFTEADFTRMASLRADGWTLKAIGHEYGVTGRMIGLYLTRLTLPSTG